MLVADRYRRHRLRLIDLMIAVCLFFAHLALLVSTMDMGFTRDEGYYFHAAEDYHGWFEEWEQNREAGNGDDSFTMESIGRHWDTNPEHPVLMKTLFGLSWHELSVERDLMPPTSAMRFPTAVFAAFLPALLFLFFVEAFGARIGGLFSVSALIFMPRYFFHSHLACFDSAMSTMWFAVMYAYWKSYHSRTWAWLTGILFGISLITKLNAFFIPFALLLHWALTGAREFKWVRHEGKGRIRIPKIPLAFVTMVLLGPLIFYLGWPRHWFDTFNRVTWYIGRHWNHEHYYVYYFGEALIRPPFSVTFPFVMTLVTVPLVTLLTGAFGGAVLGAEPFVHRRKKVVALDPRGTGWLILINLLFPILIIARPTTPIFGGTKHWMHAMPWLCVLAGVGAVWVFSLVWRKDVRLGPDFLRSIAMLLLVAVLSIPLVHATFTVHPHGTAYYNEVIGGVRGAADAEMMRQFWGYSTRSGLEHINETARQHARLFPHNANGDAMHWYREDGLLRDDFLDAWSPNHADYAFFNHQKAFVPVIQDIWEGMGTTAPMRVWTVNGVPVFSIYANDRNR